jgi:hypothetical protein
MKTRTAIFMVAAGVGLGALVFLLQANRELRASRERLTALETRRQAASGELRRAEQRAAGAEKQQAELQARVAAPPALPPAPVTAQPVRAVPARTPSREELIATDGRLHALAVKAERAQIEERYRALFQALRLTPSEIETFMQNALKRWEQATDLANLRRSADAPDRAAIRALISKADEGYRAAQKDLLGDAGFGEFERFERTAAPRGLVNQVAGAAALRGTALGPEQADQLLRLLANASDHFRTGGNARLSEGLDWTRLDAQAATLLSPAQFALWKASEARWWGEFEFAFEVARKKAAGTTSGR